jgi:hypothetical protein
MARRSKTYGGEQTPGAHRGGNEQRVSEQWSAALLSLA